tara:strand:+ start:3168 stop:4553 length:1386 start_codon:yes stop_codon:yes gene_type:complete
MLYFSTRDTDKKFTFEEIILNGLAADGGLYIPEKIPTFTESAMNRLLSSDYQTIAYEIIKQFTGETFTTELLKRMIHDSYKSFRSDFVTPLREVDDSLSILELFHGPTLAFKDLAMQLLSRMIEEVLSRTNSKASIICATSGDTGGAAVTSFANKKNIKLFVLYPKGRISEVQRRFMSTVEAENIKVISINGNFDDCQNIVKNLFSDRHFANDVSLTAVNSINWARIMIQIVYYFSALSQYKRSENNINFIVPTGNFGDIFAGYIAKRMGLPFHKLVIATNVNNILERCLKTGVYEVFDSIHTNTPSMDIQISSNFERLLFDLLDMSSGVVGKKMTQLRENGKFELSKSELKSYKDNFDAGSLNQDETVKIIKDMYNKSHQVIDPHTAIAVGIHYKNSYKNSIVLSTAHAAKFPDTVEKAIGINPDLPNISDDIYKMHENIIDLPNDVADIRSFIKKNFSE